MGMHSVYPVMMYGYCSQNFIQVSATETQLQASPLLVHKLFVNEDDNNQAIMLRMGTSTC